MSKKKETPKYIARFAGLIDVGLNEHGTTCFIVLEDGELKICNSISLDGQTYTPPPAKTLPWLLPRTSEVLRWYEGDSDKALYEDLRASIEENTELPSEAYYDILTPWVLHTYLIELFQYTPYLWMYSPPQSGKTRTGKACIYTAYRGLFTISLREAYIFRLAQACGVTLFIDTIDLWETASKDTRDLLLSRFERGISVPRVLSPEKSVFDGMAFYETFGATIIATNEPVHDTLDSRAIQINMPSSMRHYHKDVTPEGARGLKERLVAFRARNIDKDLPEPTKVASRRLGDIIKPLHQMILLTSPEREATFISLINEIDASKKADSSDTVEGELVAVVIALKDKVNGGLLSIKHITTHVNAGLPPSRQLRAETIGRRLGSLGFKKRRQSDGMYIEYDESKLSELARRYGLGEPT